MKRPWQKVKINTTEEGTMGILSFTFEKMMFKKYT